MSKSDKLEDYKKEIRSILITYQKGCYLSEFNRTYKDFIGTNLPSRELGFQSDAAFLYTIPDVVRVTPSGTGDYHLQGIADAKSKHIQKMVCKQKPAKLRPPAIVRSRIYEHYSTPPRFNGTVSRPVRVFEPRVFEPQSSPVQKPPLLANPVNSVSKPSPKEEIVNLVKRFKHIPLTDLLSEYEKLYHKSFSLTKYQFSSLEECIENIPELELLQKENKSFVVHVSEISNFKEIIKLESVQNTSKISSCNVEKPKTVSTASNSVHSRNNNHDNGNVPKSMISKLQQVAKKYPQGIWSSHFLSYFEEITTTTLDLHSLGYKSLVDFIDEVPEIFVRKPIAGNKKDFIIYAADEFKLNDSHQNDSASLPQVGALLVDYIISNIRKILEAYTEGIKLQEFLHVYSINCTDSLRVQDLGFGNLDTFLTSIKERVPLRFESINGVKTIYLLKLSDSPSNISDMPSQVCQQEAIPFDAVSPDFKFKVQSLPPNYEFGTFIPTYIGSIATPGHLYIQLQEETISNEFSQLGSDIDYFCNGDHSKRYAMKNAHIKVGAACVAQWPSDQGWYRAEISSIPSMENVEVLYVDYGMKDIIPISLLKYLRKAYAKLPAQAIRSRLAYIKPSKNAAKWNLKANQRLLELTTEIVLMVKIEEVTQDGIFSIVLCDTNGSKDIYINDVLCNEEIAEWIDGNPNNSISPESPVSSSLPKAAQIEYYNISPLQALQARYFLESFAACAPPFAQNEKYISLMQQVSMYCPNIDPMHNSTQPFNPALRAPNPSFFPSSTSASTCAGIYPSAVSTPGASMFPPSSLDSQNVNPLPPPVSAMDNFIRAPTPSDPYLIPKSGISLLEKNSESEIFEDDDDEMFNQFCQKITSKTVRFVKRIMLSDGYKIHIIVAESQPYASSGDISQLIWNNQEADYLFRRLQLKEAEGLSPLNLSEDGNEELFNQLERYKVKGVRKTTGFKSSILLYPLKVVIKILNLFGHPSLNLRFQLTEEATNFNIDDPIWKDFSVPEEEPEEEENHGVTDDDKIERFCLFDLLAMKEGIKHRRSKMMNYLNDSDNSKYVDEIGKLEHMQQKVLQRIAEIKEICELFK